MNELVKYHNELNSYDIGRFSASQADLFSLVVFSLKDTNKATITYDDISEKLGIQKKHKDFKFMQEMSIRNILGLQHKWVNEKGTAGSVRNIFDEVHWDDETEEVTFEIKDAYRKYFNELKEQFTVFSLSEFISIKGRHSKTLYRLLKQWKSVGKTPVFMLDEFRFLFGLGEKYKISDIDRWVINPSVEELQAYFSNLEVHKQYEKRKGKGRPKLEGYYFSFDKQSKDAAEPTQERVAEVTGWQEAHGFCPKCQRRIYQKRMENENGSWIMYGHPDFKTGDCSFWTNDSADLLQEYQLDVEPATEEQIENKKKLSSMFKNLFR